MKTIEIVVEQSDMPEHCAYNCNFCTPQGGVRRLCLATLKDVTESIDKRADDCPLVAWQSSDSAPRDRNLFLIRFKRSPNYTKYSYSIAFFSCSEKFMTICGHDVTKEFEWMPLPKTPEVMK